MEKENNPVKILKAADPEKLAAYRASKQYKALYKNQPRLDKMGRKLVPRVKIAMTEETANKITDARIARKLRNMF